MAPPAVDADVPDQAQLSSSLSKGITEKAAVSSPSSASRLAGPLQYAGTLDIYESFDSTAVIGREFPTLQLSEILNDDAKLRDLAVLGMGRIFFTLVCSRPVD